MRHSLGQMALFLLLVGLMLGMVACDGTTMSPTPTTWYLVITNTPAPTPPPTLPAPPTGAAAPAPTETLAPAPTSPPLPTTPPTRLPTQPPLPTVTAAPLPTSAPTSTPAPTTPPQNVCQGDETMSFDPPRPIEGAKLAIEVTSAKAHQNVRLDGPGNPGNLKVDQEGNKHIWRWDVTVPKSGRLDYTFYVGNVPCTANYCTAGPAGPEPTETSAAGVELTCTKSNVTGGPGKVSITVTIKNTGSTQNTFNVSISVSAPAGWRGMFCFGEACRFEGAVVPRTLGPSASEQIEVDITILDFGQLYRLLAGCSG